MDRIRHTLRRNCLVIAYVLFFAGFTSIAVWDAKEIITDYVYENRFTLVKAKNSKEDGYPFLDKPRVCLSYDRPPIPGITWNDFFALLNDSWHQRDIDWPKSIRQSEKILGNKIMDLIKYNYIELFDPENDLSDLADTLQVGKEQVFTLVDMFMQNLQNVTLNKNELFNRYGNRFIEATDYSDSVSRKKLILDGIGYTKNEDEFEFAICFLLPLIDDLAMSSNENSQFRFDIRDFDDINISDRHQHVPTAKKIHLNFLGENYEYKNLHPRKNVHVVVNLGNSQILDSTRFPPCTNDFKNEKDCFDNLRQSIREQICECEQFGKSNNKNVSTGKKICTLKTYEQCWEKANKEYWRQEQITKEKRYCKPCKSATSSVKTSSSESLFTLDNFLYQRHPRYYMDFERPKETYLVFEEKSQLNFSQLMSQIGGDLGLYIGFSMTSLLQLILLIYRMHRQQRRRNFASDQSINRNWGDCFRFYARYIGKSIGNSDEENFDNLAELKEIFQKQERQLQDTVKELDDLKQQVKELLNGQQNKYNFPKSIDEPKMTNANEIQQSRF